MATSATVFDVLTEACQFSSPTEEVCEPDLKYLSSSLWLLGSREDDSSQVAGSKQQAVYGTRTIVVQ